GTELIHARGGTSRKNALRLGLSHCHASSDLENKVPAYPRDGKTDWMKDTLTGAKFSVMSDFHKGVEEDNKKHLEETGRHLLERTSRDISLYHAGVSLTRTDFKQANRLAENLLITAEKFATIGALYGADYPEAALDKAWRQILCGQHHDSITGTNNEISFVDLMIQYREAVDLAAEIVKKSTTFIASGIRHEQKGMPIVVFNPHPWQRQDTCQLKIRLEKDASAYVLIGTDGKEYGLQEICRDSDGKSLISFMPKIKGLGYASFYLEERREPAESGRLKAFENVIENEFYRLEVDPKKGGGIVSIFDKKARREVLKKGEDGPANRLVILKQVPDRMETQHEFYTTGHKMFSADYEAQVESVKGNNFTKLIIRFKMDTVAKIKQEVTLYQGLKRIDFKTTVEDYQAKDDLFTLTFPLDVKGGRPIFDDRFAPAVRGESDKKLEFQTHQYAMVSRCQVYAANQWMDYGPGLTLGINKRGSVNVGMSQIIRPKEESFISSTELLTKLLTKKAIPVTVYPD
ncbi:MAG TPA: glycoside hydrolase family 38 C-terminal domain-containing protein, partial [Oscillospiraceae bacterium]|nr:glycoside hydrolase family 38 C-terminal domain-containing protein [Oscillospiraceae bacterium]